MNCFTHGIRFLDNPYYLVGTAVPDWLTLIDRKVRVRKRLASEFLDHTDAPTRDLAGGIVQHHDDDGWFHDRAEFVQLNLELSIQLRDLLGADSGFRPHFVAHVVIEMLLDASLTERDQAKLDLYYEQISQVDPQVVEDVVNRIAPKSTNMLAWFVPRFIEEAYIYDYLDDERLMYRMNRILKRVKLGELPNVFLKWLPAARERVYRETDVMLAPMMNPATTTVS